MVATQARIRLVGAGWWWRLLERLARQPLSRVLLPRGIESCSCKTGSNNGVPAVCCTEAAGGSDPMFCLTPNLVFAPVLACALLLPSCSNVFLHSTGYKKREKKVQTHQSYQAAAWQWCSNTFFKTVHMFLAALVEAQNRWVTQLFSIFQPIIRKDLENHTSS